MEAAAPAGALDIEGLEATAETMPPAEDAGAPLGPNELPIAQARAARRGEMQTRGAGAREARHGSCARGAPRVARVARDGSASARNIAPTGGPRRPRQGSSDCIAGAAAAAGRVRGRVAAPPRRRRG